VLLVALVALVGGCAVDTESLVCAPGHTRRGDGCIDLEPTATSPTTCAAWRECAPTQYCGQTGPDGFGVCVTRCDVDNRCEDNEYCSASGLCLVAGDVPPGAPCDGALKCAEGNVCALNRNVCVEVCDPRTADTCGGGQCLANSAGLGVCDSL